MKKSMFLTVAIAIVVIGSILLTSCDKKTTVAPDHGGAMVTMTYTPNPATVNTPIEFNFSVMEDNVAKEVTDVTGEMMMGMSNLDPMMVEKTGTGMYMGTYTFTKSDSCKITFNYKHDGTMNMKEFTIFVK